jgi:hypothetical protein
MLAPSFTEVNAMPNFTAKFHKLLQDSQDLGSNDDYMVSRVFFTLEVDGKNVGDYTAILKQAVGSDFNDANIEVGPPTNYDGPFNHQGFSRVAQHYFNTTIGAHGAGIRIEGPVREIRMRNNAFLREAEYGF